MWSSDRISMACKVDWGLYADGGVASMGSQTGLTLRFCKPGHSYTALFCTHTSPGFLPSRSRARSLLPDIFRLISFPFCHPSIALNLP